MTIAMFVPGNAEQEPSKIEKQTSEGATWGRDATYNVLVVKSCFSVENLFLYIDDFVC